MLPVLAFFSMTFAQAQQPPQPIYKESSLVIVAEDQTIEKDFLALVMLYRLMERFMVMSMLLASGLILRVR